MTSCIEKLRGSSEVALSARENDQNVDSVHQDSAKEMIEGVTRRGHKSASRQPIEEKEALKLKMERIICEPCL